MFDPSDSKTPSSTTTSTRSGTGTSRASVSTPTRPTASGKAFDLFAGQPAVKPGEPAKVEPLEEAHGRYRAAPTPAALQAVVQHLQPTIDRAVKMFAQTDNPVVRSRAKILAARAVRSFDPSKGASLTTHVHQQLQQLRRVAPELQDPLVMPERLRQDRGATLRAIDELTNNLGREPSDEEVAEHARLPVKRIVKVRQLMRAGVPMSQISERDTEDDDESDVDPIAHQHTPEEDWVDAVYHDLGDVDRIVLQHRTGYRGAPQLSNNEIARKLNLSAAAVSQRAARIQAKIDEFYR